MPKFEVRVETYRRPYDARTLRVDLPGIQLWFSYCTVVAFRVEGHCIVTSKNVWSNTTGKHLNELATKDIRVDHDEFEQRLQDALTKADVACQLEVR